MIYFMLNLIQCLPLLVFSRCMHHKECFLACKAVALFFAGGGERGKMAEKKMARGEERLYFSPFLSLRHFPPFPPPKKIKRLLCRLSVSYLSKYIFIIDIYIVIFSSTQTLFDFALNEKKMQTKFIKNTPQTH